jgi:fumarylpyruvate hydrolase
MNAPSAAPSPDAYVFAPAPPVAVPVAGTGLLLPVHRIYCVGRNYAAHAVEMGHDPDKEPPFFFQKNPDNLLVGDQHFPYPAMSEDVHFELEMVVALGAGGTDVPVERAMDLVYGYAVGLDMTRRDLQGEAKKLGRPWEVGKAFEHSAPCSTVRAAAEIGHPTRGRVWLDVIALVLLATRAEPGYPILSAVMLAVAMAVLSTGIFVYALGLPFRIWP